MIRLHILKTEMLSSAHWAYSLQGTYLTLSSIEKSYSAGREFHSFKFSAILEEEVRDIIVSKCSTLNVASYLYIDKSLCSLDAINELNELELAVKKLFYELNGK